jgi:hypothetical protein
VKRAEGYLAELENNPPRGPSQHARLADELSRFLEDFEQWWRNDSNKHPSGGKPLADALTNARYALPSDKGPRRLETALVAAELKKVVAAGVEMRNNPLLGNLEPDPAGHPGTARLSELSGPRSSRPFDQLRVDDHGRPQLPAENTAYLGRSLFGDYMLAVELAGLLLLVATVGAIAIAQRRPAPPAPPRNVMASR